MLGCAEEVELERLLCQAGLPKVAVEVDGPFHFFRNIDRQLGRNMMKHRLLEQLDWRVVQIPYYHWNECMDKEACVLDAMEKAGVNPQAFLATNKASAV